MKKLISVKVMGSRLASYMPLIQFPMVGYLFVKQLNWNTNLMILIFGLACLGLAIVDYKWIFPGESILVTEKNPIFMKMQEDMAEIKGLLQKSKAI